MSNRFTSITATNATVENLSASIVQGSNANPIQIISDVNFNTMSATKLNTLGFTNYEISEDYINKTLAIRVLGTRFKGAIYDSILNRPYEQIIPLSQTYTLPADNVVMTNDMIANPYKIFVIEPTQNIVFELPELTTTNVFQNAHVRFTNNTSFLVSFTYKGAPLIQMGYETISLVWRTNNGTDYLWVYIP